MQKKFRIKINSPFIIVFTALSLSFSVIGWYWEDIGDFFYVYFSSWLDPLMYMRMFSYVLMHADVEHITGNFLLILTLGPLLEEKYGAKALLQMTLLTAFVTGVVHVLVSPDIMLCGASGIAFMFIVLSTFANTREGGGIPLTFLLVVAVYLGSEFYDAFTNSNTGISQLAHIAGGVLGGLYGYVMTRGSKSHQSSF